MPTISEEKCINEEDIAEIVRNFIDLTLPVLDNDRCTVTVEMVSGQEENFMSEKSVTSKQKNERTKGSKTNNGPPSALMNNNNNALKQTKKGVNGCQISKKNRKEMSPMEKTEKSKQKTKKQKKQKVKQSVKKKPQKNKSKTKHTKEKNKSKTKHTKEKIRRQKRVAIGNRNIDFICTLNCSECLSVFESENNLSRETRDKSITPHKARESMSRWKRFNNGIDGTSSTILIDGLTTVLTVMNINSVFYCNNHTVMIDDTCGEP